MPITLCYRVVSAIVGTIPSGKDRKWSDAAFILIVFLVNGAISTLQEHAAERSAGALKRLITQRARVRRDGAAHDIDAESELLKLALVMPGAMQAHKQ